LDENDVREYPEADRRFHHAFNWLAGNTILTDAIMGLRKKMLLYFSLLRRYARETNIKFLKYHHIMAWEPIFAEAPSLSIKSSAREPLAARRSGTAENRNTPASQTTKRPRVTIPNPAF
jgi:hypothetical protein